jgi:glutamate/tyrosine decarboxylase-like PLP-dependent enzyme
MKLWMSLRTYGAPAFRRAIQTGIDLAEFAESYLRARPGTWEIASPAQLGIVCFSLRGADAQAHADRAARVSATGYACVSSTVLKGRPALRLCTINPLTTQADIARTIDMLAEAP